MQNLLTLRDVMSIERVINTKQTWSSKASSIVLNSVLLLITSKSGILFPHEYRRTKTKGTLGDSFRFDNFFLQNGRNSVEDEESIDTLCFIHDNSDYL